MMEERIPASWSGRIPPVIRYMERKYVDRFFDCGELLLTTFERCSVSDDISRGDRREGKLNSLVRLGSGRVMAGLHGVGRKSYMLCTSLVESCDLVQSFEGADDYFRVESPRPFADAIASVLHGCRQILIGPREYSAARSAEGDDPDLEARSAPLFRQMLSGDEAAAMRAIEEHQRLLGESFDRLLGARAYFAKVADTHGDESEFRFVWLMEQETGADPLLIHAPDAVQFCSRK